MLIYHHQKVKLRHVKLIIQNFLYFFKSKPNWTTSKCKIIKEQKTCCKILLNYTVLEIVLYMTYKCPYLFHVRSTLRLFALFVPVCYFVHLYLHCILSNNQIFSLTIEQPHYKLKKRGLIYTILIFKFWRKKALQGKKENKLICKKLLIIVTNCVAFPTRKCRFKPHQKHSTSFYKTYTINYLQNWLVL